MDLVLDVQRRDADVGVARDGTGDLRRTAKAYIGVRNERRVAGDAGDHRRVVDKVVLVREAAAWISEAP